MEEVVQAVRSGAVPSVEIPTDDHLKRYRKQRTEPDMAELVAATKARSRYKEQNKS
jgi:hypothetical protein